MFFNLAETIKVGRRQCQLRWNVKRYLLGSGCGSVVERSPSTPEIRGSNPGIGKLLSNICLLSTVLKRRI